MKTVYYIGIDPGVATGVAVWDSKNKTFLSVGSMSILEAIDEVSSFLSCVCDKTEVLVRIEDARKRRWFGNAGVERLQGAGSIKRDCSIWEEFVTKNNIKHQLVAPANVRTKLNHAQFSNLTKYTKQTNEHGRDAAMLVFGL